MNKPILRALKDSGILTLGFGVESMSNKILASMEKRITKDQIERAFKLAADEGVRAEGNIILGDPQETEETCKESIDWWMKHPQYDITPGFLLAVPDAPVYRYALAHNLIKDKLQFIKDKFPVINLTKLDNDKFYRIYRKIAYYTLSQKYLLRGRVLCSKKESEIYYGKHVYSFEIECSVCRHISKYKYILYSSRPYSIILCKNCYKRLKISTKKAFPLDYNAFKGFLFHNAFLIYFMYFKKYSFFSNTAKMLKRILRKVGLPEYGGWLK